MHMLYMIVMGLSFSLITGCTHHRKSTSLLAKTPQGRKKTMEYKAQLQLKPTNLDNISQRQIDTHWGLYEGYVTNVNKLNKELEELRAAGKVDTPLYADRRRRYGFEYNGMVLHEYYFANLQAGGTMLSDGALKTALVATWGSYDTWRADFESAGKSRSIGWAILYADETTGALTNHFIQEHEDGTIAGFAPILVLDVWEHAYMVDFGTAGRAQYITEFMRNIHWAKVEERYAAVKAGKIIPRF